MHKFVESMSPQRKVVIIKLSAFVHIGLQKENVKLLYICTAHHRLHTSYLLYNFILM